MRQIKFRAWDGKKIHDVRDLHWDAYGGLDIEVSCQPMGTSAHAGFRLMQFTGLKDKNGKEIYDGHIVKIWCEGDGEADDPYEETKAISFEEGQWVWGNDGGNSQPLYELDPEYMVVIGNIYENPELLTG